MKCMFEKLNVLRRAPEEFCTWQTPRNLASTWYLLISMCNGLAVSRRCYPIRNKIHIQENVGKLVIYKRIYFKIKVV